MRAARAAATCALAVGAVVASAAPALAQPQSAYAEVKNVVQTGANPDEAVVTVKYRCSGTGFHLWASVKQGDELRVPDRTTSEYADAWYETPDEAAPTCDGQNHVERIVVGTEGTDGFGRLHRGPAYVQFVIYYADPTGAQQRIAWNDPGAMTQVR